MQSIKELEVKIMFLKIVYQKLKRAVKIRNILFQQKIIKQEK